jgi:hypothetical protein
MVLSLLRGRVAEIKTQGKQKQTANGKQPGQMHSCALTREGGTFEAPLKGRIAGVAVCRLLFTVCSYN